MLNWIVWNSIVFDIETVMVATNNVMEYSSSIYTDLLDTRWDHPQSEWGYFLPERTLDEPLLRAEVFQRTNIRAGWSIALWHTWSRKAPSFGWATFERADSTIDIFVILV